MLTFDQILSDRIGFGQFQWKTFLIIGLIDFLDGSESQYLSVLNLVLYQEWSLSTGHLVMIGTIFNIGLLTGNLICALYADRFGRKNLLKISTVVQFITIMLTTVVQNYNQFIIIRFLYGLELGVVMPLSHLLITECTPMKIRGKFLVALQLLFVFGRIWMVLVEMIFLDNLSEGNWRAIALINGIPAFLCMLGSYLYIEESARFLIISGHFEEGRRVIDKMGQENKGEDFELSDDEFNQIKEWQVQNFQRSIQQRSIYGLFNEINFKFTWRAWVILASISLVVGGMQLIIPFLFADEQKTLFDLLIVSFVEVPAFIFVFALIDNKQLGGRKCLTLFGCFFESVALLIIWYFQGNFLLTGLIMFQVFVRVKGLAFIPMITESYNTVYRSLGIGSALCVYRISGAFVPALVFPLYEKDKYKFFLLSLISTFIMFVITLSYPVDLTKKPLDELYSDIIEDKQFTPKELYQEEKEKLIDENKQKLNND